MNNKYELIYEGKAKKVFSHDDSDKVIIEFKDDATAFNAMKKAKFEGKGKLNCQISARIFELLVNNNIPTHFLELKNENTMIAKRIKVIPLEIVLRNTAYGSLCKQTTIKSGTVLAKPLIDIYLKNGKKISGRGDFGKGSPMIPMTYDEVADKFMGCCEFAKWPTKKAKAIIQAVSKLEKMKDISKLSRLLSK